MKNLRLKSFGRPKIPASLTSLGHALVSLCLFVAFLAASCILLLMALTAPLQGK